MGEESVMGGGPIRLSDRQLVELTVRQAVKEEIELNRRFQDAISKIGNELDRALSVPVEKENGNDPRGED
jgi:hypothetical protein